MPEKKLGRSLDSLMNNLDQTIPSSEEVINISVNLVIPNQFQPRKKFDDEKMHDLVNSITENGILQPITVRRAEEGFEIIAGERRWRAAQLANFQTIPAIVREVSDEKMLELALIENIQREDLDPIERATAFKDLLTRFQLTQEMASSRLGIDRSSLANLMRLLELPEEIQQMVSNGLLSAGHGRTLLSLSNKEEQLKLATRIVREELSVRKTEQLVAASKQPKVARQSRKAPPYLKEIEGKLRVKLGTRVNINQGRNRGKIIIEFYNNDDLNRLLEKFEIL